MLGIRRMMRMRMPRRSIRRRDPLSRKSRASNIVLLVLIALMITVLCLYLRLTPLVTNMAVAAAENAVTKAVNAAIAEKLSEGQMNYTSLVNLEKDSDGKVTALICNMASVNSLKADITYSILQEMSEIDTTEIGVPLGNLIGSALFSGKGPRIPVSIVTVGSVKTDFSNRFSSSGINQTRHQIVVSVEVNVSVLIPGNSAHSAVYTEVAVAETVIVGGVPDSYTYFEGDEKWDENVERFDILN